MKMMAWILAGTLSLIAVSHAGAMPTALEHAFRFASAIRTDLNDRGRAQADVALAAAQVGQLEQARAWADEVTGWRRGMVYAELAVPLAKRGRTAEARALLAQAEEMSQRIEDWSGPRVAAHVAAALAQLGERERSAQISGKLEGEERLKALPVAIAPLVEAGQFEAAMEVLGKITGVHAFDLRIAQVRAYLKLAEHPSLRAQWGKRKRALTAALAVAAELPVTVRAETAVAVADQFRGMGFRGDARRTLAEVETALVAEGGNAFYLAPVLVQVALAWDRLEERGRCRGLLVEALRGVTEAQDIDQPFVYAAVAGGYAAIREERQARQLYATGFELAGQLINSRPRALAVVELCRSMGLHGLRVTAAEQARLQELYDGLGAPW